MLVQTEKGIYGIRPKHLIEMVKISKLRGTDLGGCWGSGTAGTGTGTTGETAASEPAAAWCAET